MEASKIKLVAFDLDGTLTQHKTVLSAENRAALDLLREKYRLVMVGAGQVMRIFNQMEQYPIDIIGNYGLQYGKYNIDQERMDIVRDLVLECNREDVAEKVAFLRKKHGFTEFAGDSVEFHPSGCITFPILGTKAKAEEKLAFDPDRNKRRAFYDEVVEIFSDYCVFVGGSSSFDMAPKPYDKYYALSRYCAEHDIAHDEAVFVGDDYGLGGNDESVYKSDIGFICVDDYRKFPEYIKALL